MAQTCRTIDMVTLVELLHNSQEWRAYEVIPESSNSTWLHSLSSEEVQTQQLSLKRDPQKARDSFAVGWLKNLTSRIEGWIKNSTSISETLEAKSAASHEEGTFATVAGLGISGRTVELQRRFQIIDNEQH